MGDERSKKDISPGELGFVLIAGGVAHELNDPLAAIRANVSFSLEQLAMMPLEVRADFADVEAALTEASSAVARAERIVRELAALAQMNDEPPVALDLRVVADAALAIIGNEVRHRAKVLRRFGPVPMVLGNEPRLRRALVHVFARVAQTIPPGNAMGHELRVTTFTDAKGRAVLEVATRGTDLVGNEVSELGHSLVSGAGGRLETESGAPGVVLRRVVLGPADEDDRPSTYVGRKSDPGTGGDAQGSRGP